MVYMKDTKGFTLIELLVVVAILGLLSSVVITFVEDARKQAASTKAIAQAQQLRSSIYLAAGEGNAPSAPASYQMDEIAEIAANIASGEAPKLPREISRFEDYYYISKGGVRAEDNLPEAIDYFCVTSNQVIADVTDEWGTWNGNTDDLAIVAWRDNTFELHNDERKRLVMPGSISNHYGDFGGFQLTASNDNSAEYGFGVAVADTGPGGDNHKELRWWDENLDLHPFACENVE